MIKKIGFIGLGIMGLPIARNLIKAGFEVRAWSRSMKNYQVIKDAGGLTAESPAGTCEISEGKTAAAAGEFSGADRDFSEVLVLMLTGPEAVDEVLFGENGVLRGEAGARWAASGAGVGERGLEGRGLEERGLEGRGLEGRGPVIVNMSTVPPEYSVKLAEKLKKKKIILVDAPVSGSKKPAEEGALVILAGGPEKTVKLLDPLFKAVGKKTVYCGGTGKGSAMKLSVNLLLGTMQAALGEAVNFAEKSGIGTEDFLDTVLSGPMGCDLFKMKKQMIIDDIYPTQFPLKHMIKDIDFAMDAAKKLDMLIPIGVQAFAAYALAENESRGEEDFSAVKRVIWKYSR